jgi:hypothetical protein
MYRIGDKAVCDRCAAAIGQMQQLNQFAAGPWFFGALFGFGAAVISGFVWALIVKATRYELGLVAIGIGFFVTRAVMRGAGGRRGPSIQVLSVLLSLLGIFVGKGLIGAWAMWDDIRKQLEPGSNETLFRVFIFFVGPFIIFQGMDLLWYGLAIWEAWRIPRAIRIPIQGPYSTGEGPAAPAPPAPLGGLQFDRVQPQSQPPPP